jgi:ERCC4-type nuclease
MIKYLKKPRNYAAHKAKPHNKMIRVVIDIREGELWETCAAHREPGAEKWYVSSERLEIGDIAFYSTDTDVSGAAAPLVVLERKTAEDLGASQKDGRYREQRARLYALRGTKVAIGYIVEAPPWSPTLSRTWCRGAFNELHLQQSIVRLNLRYGIPVFMSGSPKETLCWIRRVATALIADPAVFTSGVAASACEAAVVYTEAIHVKKADNNTPERLFLSFLLSIPGLGRTSADAIAAHTHSSFTALQALTQEELSEIQGGKRKLGGALAKVIYDAVHS